MLIFFFNDTATTEIYTLSLHDALPIYRSAALQSRRGVAHERGERQDVSRRSRELRRVARVARRELRRSPSGTLSSLKERFSCTVHCSASPPPPPSARSPSWPRAPGPSPPPLAYSGP